MNKSNQNDSPAGEEVMRHSLSHIMASAIKEIWPNTKFAIGPSIENGFYYDFDFGNNKVSEDDLIKIEKKINFLIKQNLKFEKFDVDIDEALKKEKQNKQIYKIELIKELEEQGEKKVSYYKLGNFEDLCKGPHIKSTGEIKNGSFKLMKLAGAYWRGSEKNKMLTRIYGVAFNSKEELDNYLKLLKEAEARDHRKIGKELDLFMVSEEVGQGLVMYLPKGAFIWRALENYMYEKEYDYGYSYVMTPVLAREAMYKKSGHLSHYHEDMYNPIDIEGENYYLKPMNCPHHHIMYKNSPKSYRDLPLRISDSGMIHRYERSGVLTGIIRARNFSQNDSHIYCTKEQIEGEFISVLKLFTEVYNDFNIKDYWFRLSLPDYNNKEKYGDIENKKMWEYSANVARKAMKEYGVKFEEVEGEAAFYGPKIDVQIKNVLGKEDTIATIQVDFYMPKKFGLVYINEKGKEENPVIIHRAIMGSYDRFFAFLIESTGGAFLVWIAPVQVKIISVGEGHIKYCKELAKEFKENNIRVEVDDADETVGNKIRKASKEKIPYILVIGDREIKSKNLAVRERGVEKIKEISKTKFIKEIQDKIKKRS
ncbi:MAG: threonine--tRNA ligase [Candidatus Falkowbacteria bacterium]